eukprot:COSAG01_NODE_28723_length_654_cov_1.198198_1_plen_136_part_01
MVLRLVQLEQGGVRSVAVVGDDGSARQVGGGYTTTYQLLMDGFRSGRAFPDFISPLLATASPQIDYRAALAAGEVLPPLDHPDPAHCYVTGTGLTHLGSAAGRDKMHSAAAGGQLTDSMKMFNMGLQDGKKGEHGV